MLQRKQSAAAPQVYVWDPFVRVFHWLLVTSFAIAYLTEDDMLTVHIWAGYTVGILILARILWGFFGPAQRASETSSTVPPPRFDMCAISYHREANAIRPQPWRRLHGNRAYGILSATVVTGLIVYGGDQGAGPLTGIVSKETGEALEEVHELIANITLGLVFLHISAVALASFMHHENLVRAMITGYKRP